MKKEEYDSICTLNGSLQKLFTALAILKEERGTLTGLELCLEEKTAIESATYAIDNLYKKAIKPVVNNPAPNAK